MWEQNRLLLLRGQMKKQLFTQEAANDAGEEIQLAILRTAALAKWRRHKTDYQALKRAREQSAHPSIVKAEKREKTGSWPNEVSMGTEVMREASVARDAYLIIRQHNWE